MERQARRSRSFKIQAYIPEESSEEELIAFIEDAVKKHPWPGQYSELDRSKFKVTRIKRY